MTDDVESSLPQARPLPAAAAAALRVGVALGIGFLALSVLWDLGVAPEYLERLLKWRGGGAVVLLVLGIASYGVPHQSRWLLALAVAAVTAVITATALILPFGFAYGIGGLMSVAMAIGFVSLEWRTAAAAGLAVLVAVGATLWFRGGNQDLVMALGFFIVPGVIVATVFAHMTSLRIKKNEALRNNLKKLRDDLERFGRSDELTGVHDKKQINSLARREIALARRRKTPLSALKIDVEQLERINKMHGREAGDETLRAVASMCQASLRETDLLARVAGDEFAALLPEADAAGAAIICERLRKGLEKASVLAGDQLLTVTVVVGAATLADGDQGFDELLGRADLALRAAKSAA